MSFVVIQPRGGNVLRNVINRMAKCGNKDTEKYLKILFKDSASCATLSTIKGSCLLQAGTRWSVY